MTQVAPENVDTTIHNESDKPDSNLYQIIKRMKRKFPSFIMFIHICMAKFVFICDINYISQVNSTDVIKTIIYTDESESIGMFWGYLIFMCTICFVWEFLHIYFRYKRKKKKFNNKSTIIFALVSAIISIAAFLATVFYMNDNSVFDCFINFDEFLANFAFLATYGILCIISIIEHYCFPQFY